MFVCLSNPDQLNQALSSHPSTSRLPLEMNTKHRKKSNLETEHHRHSSQSSTPTVEPDIRTKDFSIDTFRRLNMGLAITREYKLANTPAFRINADDPPLFGGVSSNKRTEKIQCHSAWAKDYVDSQMASAAAEVCAHLVTAEAHTRTSSMHRQSSFDSNKYQYETTILQLTEVMLIKDNLIVVDTFRDKITQAVNMKNQLDRKTELQKVFDEYGYFWPSKIALGGKLMNIIDSSDTVSITDRKSGHDTGAASRFRSELLSGLGFGSSIRHSRELGTGSSTDVSTREAKHHVIGGNINMSGPEWEASVCNNPHYWDIINRDSIIPIWRMLDEELSDKVEEIVNMSFKDRLSVNTVYHIRNSETLKILSWKPYNYHKCDGRIIATSPVMSGESNENNTWKFVRVPNQEEPSNQYEKSYLRYEIDRVYIQPNLQPNDYLHASQNYPSPVTKREGQVSLRQIDDPYKRQQSDVWVIERCNNLIHEDPRWRNIDLAMRTNKFVQKGDEFRLKCLDSGYLASHDKSMEEVIVDVPRKSNESGFRKAKLKSIPKIFAAKFKEVFIVKENEVGEDKVAIWKVDQ